MISFAFLAIVIAMSYQLAVDAMHAAQYAQELQQSQRALERLARANLLGELSSAIAHELNQPLGAILNNTNAGRRLLESKSGSLPEIREILDDIVRDDTRAADIIQRLRRLLQTGAVVHEPLDINVVLQETLDMLDSEIRDQGVALTLAFEKGFMVWAEPFVALRIPKIFNLRTDPFERADTDANNYERWWIERIFALVPAQTFVQEYIDTFQEFPPRQKPAKFNVDDALSTLKAAPSN